LLTRTEGTSVPYCKIRLVQPARVQHIRRS